MTRRPKAIATIYGISENWEEESQQEWPGTAFTILTIFYWEKAFQLCKIYFPNFPNCESKRRNVFVLLGKLRWCRRHNRGFAKLNSQYLSQGTLNIWPFSVCLEDLVISSRLFCEITRWDVKTSSNLGKFPSCRVWVQAQCWFFSPLQFCRILWDKNFVHPWLWIQWVVVSVSKKFQGVSLFLPRDQITNFPPIWNVEKIEKKVSFKES